MSAAITWPQERLHRFWALQARALKANVRLTANTSGDLHLHNGKADAPLANLDEAEAAIVATENAERPA